MATVITKLVTMKLINATRMAADYTVGMEPSGREYLLVVVKGTFKMRAEQGARLQLHEEQTPLILSDVFYGEPGESAPKYEMDFALRKPRCDVLLNASAYAPGGRAARRVEVAVQCGAWSKSFAVVGDRVWKTTLGGIDASSPIPFVTMPITYDRAFGGGDELHDDSSKRSPFWANPSGRGFHSHYCRERIHGAPLPNTEELHVTIARPKGDYKPMSFGPIGRNWAPRAPYAGTYDQTWLDEHFPFLPPDFDERYYQSAPLDQQLPMPVGEQRVTLLNLTPDGNRAFLLPHFVAPVHVFPKRGERESLAAYADTIVIEPTEEKVTMVWRVARPLKKNMFEIAKVLVGRIGDHGAQSHTSSAGVPGEQELQRDRGQQS